MSQAILLQITSFLKVIPVWLPPVAIASGFLLVSIGMGAEYFERLFGHWSSYSPPFAFFGVVCLTGSIASAMYVSINRQNLTLLFVFFTFMSGRIIQGAIAARIIQKIAKLLFSDSDVSGSGLVSKVYHYIIKKLKQRAIVFVTTFIIIAHTSLSISAVYVIGTGNAVEAIERFWMGFFFLTISGMVFDFRHFAHRISWTAAIGLIIAITGAFLYNPVNFSAYASVLGPYLENPVPEWIRLPLGAVGFLFGVLIWAVFYTKEG